MKSLRRCLVGAIVAFETVGCPRLATGAGFAIARFGGEHGSVVTTNATALYYNPAGIAFAEGTSLLLDGQLAFRHATWDHAPAPTDPPDPPGAQGASSGQAHLFNVFAAPALFATTRFGDLAVGAGVFVPFGGRESWAPNDHFSNPQYPLASAGIQRWHVVEGSLTFVYFSGGAAYRLGPLSVGVAGSLVASSVLDTQAKNPTGQGDPDTAREGRTSLDVSGLHGALGVGVALEAIPRRLWFGASYQSQPGLGPQRLTGTLKTTSPYGNTSFDVTLTQALPDVVRAGTRWRPTQELELRLFGDYTRWSVMQTQCVALSNYACAVYPNGSDASGGTLSNFRRNWNDTYGVRLGASYWVKREVELFAGTGFETAATPDSTLEPSFIDGDNIEAALGGRFMLGRGFCLAASYTHLQYFDRNNTGKSTLAEIGGAAVMSPTRQPDAGGRYTQWVGLLDVNIEKTF
jgi:long-chain fatty acid transport protein